MTKPLPGRPRGAESLIEVLASDLTYVPNFEQRKTKEAFWLRFNENPTCEAEDIACSLVMRLTGDGRLERWWSQSGFKEWFRNQEEFRERAASLAHMALDTIQSILMDLDAQPSARVTAAKLALEIARKMPTQTAQPKYLDDGINKMDKAQLEQYLARNVHLLPPSRTTSSGQQNDPNLTVETDSGTLESTGDK